MAGAVDNDALSRMINDILVKLTVTSDGPSYKHLLRIDRLYQRNHKVSVIDADFVSCPDYQVLVSFTPAKTR
jgi:hypothetical protein